MPGSALSTLTILAHLILKQGKLSSVPIRGEEAETKQSAAHRCWPAVSGRAGNQVRFSSPTAQMKGKSREYPAMPTKHEWIWADHPVNRSWRPEGLYSIAQA